MGRDKALLPWRGRTFLTAHIDALTPYTDFVLVVAGANAAALKPLVDASGAFLLVNPDPERGQFSSLQVGLQEVLNRGRDAAIIALVDRPPAAPDTITALRRAYERSPEGIWTIVPEHAGRHGHPIVAGREMITAFLNGPVTATARDIEHENRQHIGYITVDDRFTIENIDTPEDYNRIAE